MKKTITDIEPQKKNKDRYNLFVDGVYTCGVSEYVVKKYKLEIGMVFDEKTMEVAIFEDNLERAKTYIANYHTSKTEKVIKDKLKEKGYDEKVVIAVIEFLHKYQYINDADYAKRLTNDALKIKKQGKQKIRQKLKEKGVCDAIIEETLSGIEVDDEEEAIQKLLIKKVPYYEKKSKNAYELKNKLYQFLMGRGFSFETIKHAVEKYLEN